MFPHTTSKPTLSLNKPLVTTASLTLLLGMSMHNAQADNFNAASFFGITPNLVSSNANISKTYSFTLGSVANAFFKPVATANGVQAGQSYHIDKVIGVFQLYSDPDPDPKNSYNNNTGTTAQGWQGHLHENATNVFIAAGYKANGDSRRIDNGGTKVNFTWSNLPNNAVGVWGYHVRYFTTAGATAGNERQMTTAFFYQSPGTPPSGSPVPEPAFYQMSALLGMGAIGAWRRRKKA